MRSAVEISSLTTKYFNEIPTCLYVYSDGDPERKADNLPVQISCIGFFLQQNFNKMLIARIATNLFYRNLVERIHSIGNLGLQSPGLMGKRMSENMKKIMCNDSLNDEVRNLCKIKDKNSKLVTELKKNGDQPKNLMGEVYKELSLKDTLKDYFW